MNTITEKIRVKEILIRKAEGRCVFCKPQTVQTWEEAEHVLYSLAYYDAPKAGQGYDKTDFKVTFEDGEEYCGRLDLKHPSCPDNDIDIRKHVRDFLLFYTGAHKPAWMTEEQYAQALAGEKPEPYLEYLNKYDI